jgi:hypothetical protein
VTRRAADFSDPEKTELAKRVGYHCSKPKCPRLTVGPGKLPTDKAVVLGKAAHITAAAPNGPRYDENMSPADRRSAIKNGIWLCSIHADLVDKNAGSGYSAELLHKWRRKQEKWIRERLDREAKPKKLRNAPLPLDQAVGPPPSRPPASPAVAIRNSGKGNTFIGNKAFGFDTPFVDEGQDSLWVDNEAHK